MKKKYILTALMLPLLVAGCSGSIFPEEESLSGAELYTTPAPSTETTVNTEAGPKYYVGPEYVIDGITYTPTENMAYSQNGIAGIIPSDLAGNKTANGEVFDPNALTATHKTLPLPSIARITNLDNGNSLNVRINDRGPFLNTRLLDVSPAVAKKLGIEKTANVQLTILEPESTALKKATLNAEVEVTGQQTPNANVVDPALYAGQYTVQAGAFSSQENAESVRARIQDLGNVVVNQSGNMYKVQIQNLNKDQARQAIQTLRNRESIGNPGLIDNGRWINADSI